MKFSPSLKQIYSVESINCESNEKSGESWKYNKMDGFYPGNIDQCSMSSKNVFNCHIEKRQNIKYKNASHYKTCKKGHYY